MLNKNRDEIKKYIKMAKDVMGVMPSSDEDIYYVMGWCANQAETVGMLLDKISEIINKKEEEEF